MGFILDNFAVESAILISEHEKKLEALAFDIRHTILMSKSEMWLIHLVGSASQSGSVAFNEALSKRRAESVQKFLQTRLMGIPKLFRIVAIGESSPEERKILENARDRAVGITAQLVGRIPPKIEPIDISEVIKPTVPARKDFTLQVVSFVLQTFFAPVSIGRLTMNFIIDDGATQKKYTFLGDGSGVFIGGSTLFGTVGGGRSVSRGVPQKFEAFAKLSADDFAGKGAYFGLHKMFLFGGHARGASRGLRDFPMGTVKEFEFPNSLGGSPRKGEFHGEITKEFNPLVPENPRTPLPPGPGLF
jgi:hypothetical protein